MQRRWSTAKKRNTLSKSRTTANRHVRIASRRSVRSRLAQREEKSVFSPPEDWHEPTETTTGDFKVIVQDPGPGYQHVVTPEEIRRRLAELPETMIKPLQVVQLSRMTRKKELLPCYGMQWGPALYLYPIEVSMVEYLGGPPTPAFANEVRMYGGRLKQYGDWWELVWSEAAIKDFYLNNILIHELGHLLDDRNRSYVDRERYAEWFAIEYGYKPSRRQALARKAAKRLVRRRHKAY